MTEKIKSRILPLLFGSSVAYMIIRCYHNTDALMLSAVFFVYAFLCFAVFDLIRKTKMLCGFWYVLIFVFVMTLSVSSIINAQNSALGFSKWFYAPQTEATKIPEYSFALIFGGGFFIISILYYFTQVIYRAIGTMLIMFFPLFIYAKRLDEIDTTSFVVLLGFYVALLVHNRQMKSEKNSLVILNRSYLGSICSFSMVVILLLALVPKPDVLSVQEEQGNVIDFGDSYSAPSLFSETSSLSGGELSDEILFYVEADREMFLRRQAFDDYNGEVWVLNEDDNAANLIPSQNIRYSENTLYTSFLRTFSATDESYSQDSGVKFPTVNFELPEARTVTVRTTDAFKPFYLPLPLNTISVEGSDYKKTYHGEYKPPEGVEYLRIDNFLFEYVPVSDDVGEFLSELNISFDEMLEMLAERSENTEISNADYNKYSNMYYDTYYKNENFNSVNCPEKLKKLALEITSGFDNPYEKAKALEGYFEEENFKYNPKHIAFDKGVDNFLFNSKSGACGDYATAMTLMARAAGLKARYVEGFVVSEKYDEDTYVVREYHSHAYVEVYITGFGWVVFDPTVSDYLNYYDEDDTKNAFSQWLNENYKVIVCVFLIAGLVWLLRKKIGELAFRIRIAFADSSETIIFCYNRLLKLLSWRVNKNLSSLSSTEISEILDGFNLSAKPYINKFEKACYGRYEIPSDEKEYIVSEYKRLKRAIIKLKR